MHYRSLKNISKTQLRKICFALQNRPYVKRNNINGSLFPNGAKAGFILSADFELAWAYRYSKSRVDPLVMARRSRDNIPIILKKCEEYNIPVTWATVGHLFLENCDSNAHSHMPALKHFDDHWIFNKGSWFDADPHTNEEKDPEWYAASLVRLIRKSSVKHEMACHTFSHINCREQICSKETFESEIKECEVLASNSGFPEMRSFVFPGGTYGNFEAVTEMGYYIYRKREHQELSYPYREPNGMLVTNSSLMIGSELFYIEKGYYIKRLKKYIDKAIQTNTICHFWFHPSFDKVFAEELFPIIFNYISNLRKSGKLWIGTMGEIADYINREGIV